MKKIFTMILTIAICLQMFSLTASAATQEITLGTAEGKPGEEVTVSLSVKGNPGVAYIYLSVEYDSSELTLVSATSSGLFNGLFTPSQYIYVNPYVLTWGGASNFTGDGEIAKLTFKISENATGGRTNLTLRMKEAYNQDLEDVEFSLVSGSVTVNVPHVCKPVAVPGKPATCNEAGYEAYYQCEECGKMYADAEGKTEISAPIVIPATGEHTYGEWVVQDATCTEAGFKTRTCSVCGHKETEAIPATGHTPAPDSVVVKEPTCEEPGIMEGKCAVCGETLKNEPIPALGHDYKLVEEKAPTCTEAGYKKYVCTRDESHTMTETLDALGHKWSAWTEDKETGKHVHTCEVCGETESADHNWGTGHVTVPATCVTEGEKTYVCGDCKAVKTEVISATGVHDYTDHYEENEDGKTHTAYCVCGASIEEEHDFSINGEVTVKPTTTTEGKQEMFCVCGAKTVVTLPKTAELDNVPKTGDITCQLVLGGMAVIAVLACAYFVLRRKRAR